MTNPYARQNKPRPPQPVKEASEDAIHLALMDHLATVPYKDGFLIDVAHHSPNGGTSSFRQKAKFKKMGTLNGMCDLQFFIPRGGYHGLFVELKRERGGVVSQSQKDVMAMLDRQGYKTVVTRGLQASVEAIEEYMALPATQTEFNG